MFKRINKYTFSDEFRKVRPDNFSYQGLNNLFELIEKEEEMTGEQIEFDPIAICGDYCEYENIKDAAIDFGIDFDEDMDEEDIEYAVARETQMIKFDNGYIIRNF